MTVEQGIPFRISAALSGFLAEDGPLAAARLLSVLGYASDRIPSRYSYTPSEFIEFHEAPRRNSKSEKLLLDCATHIDILFQVTDTEIAAQLPLVDTAGFDIGRAQSFIFVFFELD